MSPSSFPFPECFRAAYKEFLLADPEDFWNDLVSRQTFMHRKVKCRHIDPVRFEKTRLIFFNEFFYRIDKFKEINKKDDISMPIAYYSCVLFDKVCQILDIHFSEFWITLVVCFWISHKLHGRHPLSSGELVILFPDIAKSHQDLISYEVHILNCLDHEVNIITPLNFLPITHKHYPKIVKETRDLYTDIIRICMVELFTSHQYDYYPSDLFLSCFLFLEGVTADEVHRISFATPGIISLMRDRKKIPEVPFVELLMDNKIKLF